MIISAESVWKSIEAIRLNSPLIHNITNYVVMNTTANALLAIGASPVMAHAEEEVEEMAGIAQALVINIGTLSSRWVESMFIAARTARKRDIPVIVDPVGAGATRYRTETVRRLLQATPPAIIRGNASEIMALALQDASTKGVDSLAGSPAAVNAARGLAAEFGGVVCISGAVDIIIGGSKTVHILNGHPLMSRVTGLGCTATALCGAFAAVERDYAAAAAQAMALMGIAGEIAAKRSSGPGSMQFHFLDILYNMKEITIEQYLKAEMLP
ncbi:MAG: hydroxyethylthiazole kinase [Deltaproteobacteria bacterium]|nr:hydroxyethylthiazole kinase [Deltaproteobacteria bacterium]